MEIKATLQKPYTENQRIDFIVANNHQQGYEIQEAETELQAWGYTQEELDEQAKQRKIAEINEKIEELKQESVNEILYNNSSNIEIYKDIINGLEETKTILQ